VFSTLFVNALTTGRVLKTVKLTELAPDEKNIYQHTLRQVRESVLLPLIQAAKEGAISKDLLERWQNKPPELANTNENSEKPSKLSSEVEERFEISSFLISEKMDYEKNLTDGIISKPAYRELVLQVESQLENFSRTTPSSTARATAANRGEAVLTRIQRKLFSTNTRAMVRTLAVELEVLLQRQFTIEALLPRMNAEMPRQMVQSWLEELKQKLEAFYRAYAYYSPVLQTLFVANRVRAQSSRTLERLAESAIINRMMYARALAEVEAEYREATSDAWNLLRPTPAYLLGRHPLFKEMPRVVLRKISDSAQRRHLRAGECLIREGASSDSLAIVVAGILENKNSGGSLRLFPGDAFGERSLMEREPSRMTLVALMTTEILELKQANLEYVLLEYPLLKKSLHDRSRHLESARLSF
jgi:hypothetical protein